MRLLNRALAVVGTVVVVAAIAALVTPKMAHAFVATLVQVANTPSQPVPITDIHEPALNAFQDTCFAVLLRTSSATCNFQTVPAGKRLVIEDADILLAVSPGIRPTQVAFFTPLSANGSFTGVGHHLTATFMASAPNFADFFETHQSTRLYVDPSQTPSCSVGLSGQSGFLGTFGTFEDPFLFCNLSGHFVDVP